MTEQEKFETEIRLKLAVENEKFNSLLNAVQQQREDMKALQTKQDAEMKAMQEKINENQKDFTKQLHNNFVQTLLGVGAIMAAVGGLIISVVK